MSKLLFGLGGLFAVAWLLISAPGCSDRCADLEEVCALCTDQTYSDSCDTTVESDNQSLCNDSIPNFRVFCQGGDGGSSASGTGGNGGGSASSASSSGNGGNMSTGGSGGTASAGGAGGS